MSSGHTRRGLTWTNEYSTMIRVVAEQLADSLFRFALRLDIPGGYQRTEYVLGGNVDERAGVCDLGFGGCAGSEGFADSKG